MKTPPTHPRPPRARRLSDEEIELWIAAAKSVTRRRGANLPALAKAPLAPAPAQVAAPPTVNPAPARKPFAPPLAPLEKGLRSRLSRGRDAIDASIDLHGLTQSQAHLALRGFLAHAQSRGDRLVIVVTGKGRTGPLASSGLFDEPGVLRRSVPHWLRALDLRPFVLGFEEAGPAHGGAGALYVRLRRLARAEPR